MSEALNPEEIAFAAAQGVAIALNARKPKPGEEREEVTPRHIICGIPPVLFDVTLIDDGRGSYGVGGLINKTGPDIGDRGKA
jgi:hypothetical protein